MTLSQLFTTTYTWHHLSRERIGRCHSISMHVFATPTDTLFCCLVFEYLILYNDFPLVLSTLKAWKTSRAGGDLLVVSLPKNNLFISSLIWFSPENWHVELSHYFLIHDLPSQQLTKSDFLCSWYSSVPLVHLWFLCLLFIIIDFVIMLLFLC